jgi:hypothetical protein
MRGRRAVAIIDTPKVMTDGNWRLGMFVDDQATDEQFDKLVKVFGGQLGGAPAQERRTGGGGLAPAFAAVRVRLALVIALLALAAVGWWWTVRQMRGMDEGPWTGLGTLGWFLGIWVVMMAAMMFPSVASTVALFSRMTKQRSPLAPRLFAAGYLVTWAGAGLVAFTLVAIVGRISGDALAWDRGGRWVAGVTLFVAAG